MPPISDSAASGNLRPILHSPSLLMREVLAGVLLALVLAPEVIPFSAIVGVDPQVSLAAPVVFRLAMSILGGRPAIATAAARPVALAAGPMVHQYGAGYILPVVILAGMIQTLLGLYGMARLMRFIPLAAMTGFVNAFGILIFFAQVPHLWGRQPLIVGLSALTLLIVLWAPRFIKVVPASLIAIAALTLYIVTTGQQLPTVGDESSVSGGLPGFIIPIAPLNLAILQIIWSCALSIAFVGLMESLLTAKLVDDPTHTPSNKSRESVGLGIANILAGCYDGIVGCVAIGQIIANAEMDRAYSRLSTVIAGLMLLLLVTALSQAMAQIPMAVLAGVMVIVAVKTFSRHSIRPGEPMHNPWPETPVALVTVAAMVGTSSLAIGVLAGIVTMVLIPRHLRTKAQAVSETASPDQGK